MKKGFTLIELLAVIIILAVIALIATPIVLNVVENAREESRKQSVVGYADAIRLSYIEEQMDKTGLSLDELASSKLQGNKVSCNISKFDNRYGSMLYGCGVIENEETKGNYCYLSGKVYDMETAECGTISNIIETGIVSYKTPSTELLSQIPNSTEYAQSKEIKIKYPSLMIIEEHYFIKSSEGIELNNIIGKCGNGTTPSSCEENNDTIIESNTWYQLSGDTTFTTNSNLTIEAVTGKEEEFGEKYTYEVTNIDTTIPNTSIASISIKTDRAVVSATCNDTESGISKYEFSSDNGSTWINKGATSSHTFTGLTHGTSYTFKVRCTNGSLLTNEDEETKATLTASNPTITQLSQTPSSGDYATERVIRITYNGTGIENPSYYYSLDGNDWTSVSGTTKDVTFTSNGYLYAKTVDETGNTANASTYTVTNIDTTAPTVSASVSGKTATFTMSDNIGIVGYGVNSSTTVEPTYTAITTTTSTTITWEASQAGNYVVWVKDVAGRVSNTTFTHEQSAFSYPATLASNTYTASTVCSGGRTLSNGNCVYTYSNNEGMCGCAAYRSCATSACGVSSYNTCQNSACGYASCATSGCGVASYKSCKNSACGCNNKSYTFSTAPAQLNASIAQQCNGKTNCNCTTSSNSASYVNVTCTWCDSYKTCRTSGCEVESYKTCQNSACGYASCATSGCGVASYKSCQNSACGCATGGTCTKTENGYRSYSCNSGDSLSGTTCTHNYYTCPNGGTLSGTTCNY